MDIEDITRKISAARQKVKDSTKSTESLLEERKELYNDAIDGTDEIIRWLKYYKQDPDKPYSAISGTRYKLKSLNNAVSESPKIVSRYYRLYRRKKPLLTDEVGYFSVHSHEWRDFKSRIDEHIDFVRQLKKQFRKELSDIKDAQDRLYRAQYEGKSAKQRGDNYSRDKEDIMPDRGRTKLEEEIHNMVKERIKEVKDESKEQEDESDEDGDMSVMTPRQYIHYIIERLKMKNGGSNNGSEYYKILKDGYPNQAEVIERNIRRVSDLKRIDPEQEGLIGLEESELEYIRARVYREKKPNKNLEEFKEEYEQKELRRIDEAN